MLQRGSLCRVVDLDIGDLRIRDIGDTLTPTTFGSLTELSLSWNTLTSVRGLLSLPRLKILNLEGNRLGSGSPPLFSRSVPHFAASGMPVGASFSVVSGNSSPDAAAGSSMASGAAVSTSAWVGNDRNRCGWQASVVHTQITSPLLSEAVKVQIPCIALCAM